MVNSTVEKTNVTVEQVKSFAFTSELARQSVISESKGERYAFVKGAPEIMKSLCKQNSIPNTFERVLDELTGKGLRIISLCGRELTDGEKTIEPRINILLDMLINMLYFTVKIILRAEPNSKTCIMGALRI